MVSSKFFITGRHRILLYVALTAGVAGWGITKLAHAQTPTPISACGDVSGSVILTADISASIGYCLKVVGNNTTINGNGHTVTVTGGSDNWAVYNTGRTGLVVDNLTSNQGVYLYGSSNAATVRNSRLGNVTVAGADDVIIDHNTLNNLNVYGNSGDAALRTHVTNNTISGNAQTLVGMLGDGLASCPATEYVITDNTMTSSYACGGAGEPTCDEPKVLFLRCGTGNVVSRNTIHSLDSAMPVRLRDGFDSSTVSDNVIWAENVVDGGFAAFNITSGNNPQRYPQNNTFTRNIVRADHDEAFFIEIMGANNLFSYNTFIANSNNYTGRMGAETNKNNVFDHNTFYNAGDGTGLHFQYRNTNVNTFTNNIISFQGATVFSYDGCTNSQYQGDYNLFVDRNGVASFASYATTLAGWKALASVAPDDAHSIEGDPKFTDAAAGDFSLRSGSPALHAASDGTNIGAWQTAGSGTDTTKPATVGDLHVL